MGAEDPDDRAGHGGRVHLPQAVHPPVLRRRLRHARLVRTGRGQPARRGRHLPPQHAGRRGRGHPRGGGLPGRPVGAPQPGPGRGRRGRRGRGRGCGCGAAARAAPGGTGRPRRPTRPPHGCGRIRLPQPTETASPPRPPAALPRPPAWPVPKTCPRPTAAQTAPPRRWTCRPGAPPAAAGGQRRYHPVPRSRTLAVPRGRPITVPRHARRLPWLQVRPARQRDRRDQRIRRVRQVGRVGRASASPRLVAVQLGGRQHGGGPATAVAGRAQAS